MIRHPLHALALALSLAAPGVALAQEAAPESPSTEQPLDEKIDQFSDSAKSALRALGALLDAIEAKKPEIERQLNEAIPQIERQLDEALPKLEEGLRALGPKLEEGVKALGPIIEGLLPQYEPPITLPNGDILIRKRPRAPDAPTDIET